MNDDLKDAWDKVQDKLLFPSQDASPYYITAPRWLHSSAGIRGIYLLCHALNRMGYEAYVVQHPFGEYKPSWTNPELRTPILGKQQAAEHFKHGRTPIVLYPEIIPGNPLSAKVVVRWIMNFPGLLGGDTFYDNSEICFGYSKELAMAAGSPHQVLHVPTIDTRVFYPSDSQTTRHGGCFCAAKYKVVHNGKLDPITDGCFEITRQLPDSLTPKEVAELLRRSEVFYAYENTALATEAVLCGCPAVFIPNPYLTKMIGKDELGTDGIAWGTDPTDIERARTTVTQGAINYLKTYDLFWDQLNTFVKVTQERAQAVPYADMIPVPWPPTGVKRQIFLIKKEYLRFTRKIKKRFGVSAK